MFTNRIRQTIILAAILLLLTVAAYSNSYHNSFHFDDSHTIVNNIFIRTIANIPLFFKDSTTFSSLPSNQSYRPVVSATLAIDYWLGNGINDTFYFHLSMFIMFIIQGMLMVFFYCTVFNFADKRSAHIFTALLAAGWYLLHPANAETINYIIARSDSFSALFIVLAFVLYTSSSTCRKWHIYLLPVAVGMLTKPIAFIFPVLLLFYVFFFEENDSCTSFLKRQKVRQLLSAANKTAPAFLLMIGLLIIIKIMEPSTWTPGGTSLFQYVITQPYVILKYFLSFFLPICLSADTDLAPFKSIADLRFVIGCLFLAALLAVAAITSVKKRLRPISFGIFWFFLTLLPTSLIPLAEVMNDHRVFLPYIGLTMSSSWSVYLIVDYCLNHTAFRYCSAAATVFIAIVLTASAYGTHQRNEVWKTEETLWRDVTEKSPRNGRGLMNYGLALMAKGEYVNAEKYYLKALDLNPNYATLHINLGVLNEATGNHKHAEQYFKKAILLQPNYPDGYYYYARFLNKQRRFQEAIENLNKTLSMAASHMNARQLLMTSYLDIGDFNKAAKIARQTLRVAPDDRQALLLLAAVDRGKSSPDFLAGAKTPEYYVNLSLSFYRAGDYPQCIATAQKALQLRPGYDRAYNNICAAYNELGQWDKAIEAGKQALALTPGNTLARNNLAWAQGRKMAMASSVCKTQN